MARNDSNKQGRMTTCSTWMVVSTLTICAAVAWMLMAGSSPSLPTSVDDVLNPIGIAKDLQEYANREKKREVIKVMSI
jgi:hypothetical protein